MYKCAYGWRLTKRESNALNFIELSGEDYYKKLMRQTEEAHRWINEFSKQKRKPDEFEEMLLRHCKNDIRGNNLLIYGS